MVTPVHYGNIHPRPPLLTRVRYVIRLWLMKTVVYAFIFLRKNVLTQPSTNPTYTKRYPVLPQIECRVFIPNTYKAGDKPLPLLLDVHGGGFAIGDPVIDDRDNHFFSQKHGLLVVSVGYRLSPSYKFPTAPKDVAALMDAVLEDDTLPIDKSKVAVCGYSAGGNLCLAAMQLHGLHDRVKAAIPIYGVCDFVASVSEKLATRKSDGKKDLLADQAPAFNFGYVPNGHDRRDPLLSPRYAPRDKIPKHMYILGCEYDMLCKEMEVFADELAELETAQKILYADGTGWRKGNVRWELIEGECHGFNQTISNGKETQRRHARGEKMYADIANWLKQEVFV